VNADWPWIERLGKRRIACAYGILRGAVACVGSQGALVAEGCVVVGETVVAPTGVALLAGRGERGQQTCEAGELEEGAGTADCCMAWSISRGGAAAVRN